MLLNWLILCGIALGHACFAVWVVNIVHGHGIPERWMKPVGWATVAILAVLSAALVGSAISWRFFDWPAGDSLVRMPLPRLRPRRIPTGHALSVDAQDRFRGCSPASRSN